MGFLRAKTPPMPDLPPPAPAPVIQPMMSSPGEVESSEARKTKERLKRKKGVSSSILTGPRGLMPEQMPVTSPHLMSRE
jgi:hypothetical protein